MSNAVVSVDETISKDAFERCTEFTTENELVQSEDSAVFGAFVCPGCAKHNPLTGDPAAFCEQVVRCMGCTRVVVLDGTALLECLLEATTNE